MFSSQLGRVARASSNTLAPHHAAPLSTPTLRTASACLATGSLTATQPKQRRLSSSKASSSSSSSSRSGGSNAKALTEAGEPDASGAAKSGAGSGAGRRSGSRRSRDLAAGVKGKKGVDGGFDGLPRVASTGHLQPQDVSLSSFFSLHRPLALSTPLPPITSHQDFAALFDTKKPAADDVIHTLSNTLDSLNLATDDAQQHHDADLHWQVVQASPSNADGTHHLDSPPRPKNIEEMVAQLRPFTAPPAPVAIPSKSSSTITKKPNKVASESATPATKKSFQTTITVTENTNPDGVKYYTASTTPMVRVASSSSSAVHLPTHHHAPVQDSLHRQPFLERMRIRQIEYEELKAEKDEERAMELISTKRQRKLKMKKHKYKKLMKRTRNLRRRLDRA